jgi:adenylate kinase family enzyme
MHLKTIIFIGRSGCGKGTQNEKLINYIKELDTTRTVFNLEPGERFRKLIKEKKYASELAYENSVAGRLQPEFLSVWGWVSELIEKLERNQHLMIDGTPRRMGEAQVLESVFDFFERDNVEIVYINVSRQWAIEKMLARGRMDDQNMKSINTRLDWFESDVSKVLDFYRTHTKHIFHEINGEQSIEMVHKNILEVLNLE